MHEVPVYVYIYKYVLSIGMYICMKYLCMCALGVKAGITNMYVYMHEVHMYVYMHDFPAIFFCP